MLKHYVTFDTPGFLFPETRSVEVTERDPSAIDWPENAYACVFWDREERMVVGELLLGPAKNKSGRYLRGVPYTAQQLGTANLKPEDLRILQANMEGNGYTHVVLCPPGNWQPLLDTDTLIEVA